MSEPLEFVEENNMNRKERRAQGQRGQRPIARVRFGRNGDVDPLIAAKCPDCNSEVAITATIVGPSGVHHHGIEVRHDDSCLWYIELKRDLV